MEFDGVLREVSNPMAVIQLALQYIKAININLKATDLQNNNLAELPPEIWKLNIDTLYLGFNQLKGLPAQIGECKSLRQLYLHRNQLQELPPEIGQLTNLRELDLSGNQLQELPSEIGECKKLVTLDLSGNQLQELPPQIWKSKLNDLRLSNNKLKKLPGGIGMLPLQLLDLCNNPLSELPNCLSKNAKIPRFLCDGNLIVKRGNEIMFNEDYWWLQLKSQKPQNQELDDWLEENDYFMDGHNW